MRREGLLACMVKERLLRLLDIKRDCVCAERKHIGHRAGLLFSRGLPRDWCIHHPVSRAAGMACTRRPLHLGDLSLGLSLGGIECLSVMVRYACERVVALQWQMIIRGGDFWKTRALVCSARMRGCQERLRQVSTMFTPSSCVCTEENTLCTSHDGAVGPQNAACIIMLCWTFVRIFLWGTWLVPIIVRGQSSTSSSPVLQVVWP